MTIEPASSRLPHAPVQRTRETAAADVAAAGQDDYNPGDASTWSPLQRHAAFFDPDHDGRITLGETYRGLRELGIGTLRAAAFATLINVALGVKTGSPWHRALEVRIAGIEAGRHGSDTGVYDPQGQVDPARLDALFEQHDHDHDARLDADEVAAMLTHNRTDDAGHRAAKAEFSLLMELAGHDERQADGTERRVLTRETVEQLYDGSLFYHLSGRPPEVAGGRLPEVTS